MGQGVAEPQPRSPVARPDTGDPVAKIVFMEIKHFEGARRIATIPTVGSLGREHCKSTMFCRLMKYDIGTAGVSLTESDARSAPEPSKTIRCPFLRSICRQDAGSTLRQRAVGISPTETNALDAFGLLALFAAQGSVRSAGRMLAERWRGRLRVTRARPPDRSVAHPLQSRDPSSKQFQPTH